jgi:uncharacterized repeat protein (TIGR03803 family)
MNRTTPSQVLVAAVVLIAFSFACSGAAFGQYAENILHTFNASTGGNYINTPLISDGVGNLYGTTFRGGATDNGTFFELTSTASHGWKQTVLFNFPFAAAINALSFPQGGLTRDAEGNFYGVSPYDGSSICFTGGAQEGCGTIWKLTLTSTGWKRSILYSFTGGTDGGGPLSLVMDSAGNLYGLTSDTGYGSVFELARNGTKWTFSTLYTFTGGADGASPSTIILDKSGDLLGTAYAAGSGTCEGGCGVVFEVSPVSGGGWKESTLYSFLGGSDGGTPYGGIGLDASGNIFGLADSYGTDGSIGGEIFEISHSSGSWTESVPYTFPSAVGPVGMASDASGHLYGTTYNGGLLNLCENGCGTIFSFSPISGGWSYQTIYSFTGTFDGKTPAAAPSIPDATGNLYVATQGFLAINFTAPEEMWFELSPASGGQWKGSVVADVPTSKDGYDPVASLTINPNDQQVFYGTTLAGGSAGWGTVFVMYNFGGSGLKPAIIHNFLFQGDGGLPYGGLAIDAAGNLYGTAAYGGALDCPEGCGTVFKLSPGSDLNNWNFSTLYSFKNGADGRTPLGAAAVDAAGNVYATSSYGGGQNCGPYGCGAVIEIQAAGGSARIVHAFQGGSDGGSPFYNSITVDAAGDVYGVNTAGGANGTGVVYELSRGPGDTWKETVLYNFLPGNTYNVFTPTLDGAGNVYGNTRLGGTDNFGTVFELSRSGSVWTNKVLYNFTTSDGGFPVGGVVFDSKGNLYGLTQSKAYELSPVSGSWQETLLTAFNPASSGTLQGNLVIDSSGNLYGTTSIFGEGPLIPGIVFELTP